MTIKPSDLYYRYQRKKESRDEPKFSGKPDPAPFDRDDMYEVIPMFEAVMSRLGTCDEAVLHKLEEVMIYEMPQFISRREDVYDCLVTTMQGLIEA